MNGRVPGSEIDKHFQESQLIILDTLEKCLNSEPKDMSRIDESVNIKALLKEIGQYIGKLNNNFNVWVPLAQIDTGSYKNFIGGWRIDWTIEHK